MACSKVYGKINWWLDFTVTLLFHLKRWRVLEHLVYLNVTVSSLVAKQTGVPKGVFGQLEDFLMERKKIEIPCNPQLFGVTNLPWGKWKYHKQVFLVIDNFDFLSEW